MGFRKKVYSRCGDYVFIYTKGNLEIIVNYYFGIEMKYVIDIQVTLNDVHANLLHTSAFDQQALYLLKCELASVEEPDSLEKEMNIYAEFLKKHVKSALPLAYENNRKADGSQS